MTPAYTPLTVRARLASGIAHAAPWGISLDGLLASALWSNLKAAARAAGEPPTGLNDVDEPVDLPLPLARCTATPDLWHWAATCAYPEGRPQLPPDVRHWTGRVDHRALEQLVTQLPAVISERQGRYRARRMPLLVTPCTSVTWRAVGDPAAIETLLADITAIGKKRSQGEGHVLSWHIDTDAQLDSWEAAHLHPDGTLGRPAPAHCLIGHEPAPDGGLSTAGLRPPYMHRSRQHQLRLPALQES